MFGFDLLSGLEGFCLVVRVFDFLSGREGFLSGREVFVWSKDFLSDFDLLSGLEAFCLVPRVFGFLTYCLVVRPRKTVKQITSF